MQAGRSELRVFNPMGELATIPQTVTSPGLGDLTGKKIGILYNGKAMGEVLLPILEESLKRHIRDVKLRTWLVPIAQSPEDKAPKLKEIAEYGDGVIAVVGD
ncbi:hypothetical protein ACFLV0_06555 [Chloroflexota bacterium]